MSIATEIQTLTENTAELSTCRGNIRTALEGKGVSASDHDFSDFASDIDAIPSGGGGSAADFETESTYAGELKKHLGAYSIESLGLLDTMPAANNNNYAYFLPCKSTGNVTLDRVQVTNFSAATAWEYSSIFSKRKMEPVATGDDKNDYNVNDYAITNVGSTSFSASRTLGADNFKETFNITVSNSGGSDITVKCIRFRKMCQGLQSYGQTSAYILLYSYYFDTPLTVAAGGSQSFTITLKKTIA